MVIGKLLLLQLKNQITTASIKTILAEEDEPMLVGLEFYAFIP